MQAKMLERARINVSATAWMVGNAFSSPAMINGTLGEPANQFAKQDANARITPLIGLSRQQLGQTCCERQGAPELRGSRST